MTRPSAKKTIVKPVPAKSASANTAPAKTASKKSASKKTVSKKSAADPAPQSWHVYIVRCADGTFYTGVAIDVAHRVAEHNGEGKRGARYTRARRPVKLVYQETAAGRSEAGKREYAIKQHSRTAKRALIATASKRA